MTASNECYLAATYWQVRNSLALAAVFGRKSGRCGFSRERRTVKYEGPAACVPADSN